MALLPGRIYGDVIRNRGGRGIPIGCSASPFFGNEPGSELPEVDTGEDCQFYLNIFRCSILMAFQISLLSRSCRLSILLSFASISS